MLKPSCVLLSPPKKARTFMRLHAQILLQLGVTTETRMGSSTKAAASFLSPLVTNPSGFSSTRTCCSILRNGHLSFGPISPEKLRLRRTRRPLVVEAKKGNKKEKKNKNSKPDTHSFGLKQDETTGPFPEAILLQEKKIKEDGRVLPEFADAEEEELSEFLNLELESDLNLEEMRHYEVVYLIHQDHKDEVEAVNSKIQDFLREKQGRVWRFNDWGMRRLAYKIKKATHAHYILMNFELPRQWTNEFKSMLDKDERVIRHLVTKMDKAITEDCPPPPEPTHMVVDYEVNDMDYYDGDDEIEVDDVDYDGGDDEELDDDDERDLEGYEDDDGVESKQFSSRNVVRKGGNQKKNVNGKSKKNQKRKKVLR